MAVTLPRAALFVFGTAAILLGLSVSAVPEGSQAVVTRMGEPIRVVNRWTPEGRTGGGLIAHLPLVEQVAWVKRGLFGTTAEKLPVRPADQIPLLVDAGFRYAIAHVRGGSEKGRRWFLDGRRMKKRNSMTDFIACATHLLESGRAAPGQIVAHGLSAGGLMACGAMNIAPEAWAGVIAQVPFVDMLNTMSDADHPLVPLFRPDWGDPLADPQAYDYIASISPYENVVSAAYPPLLCTAGLKDDRVPYWEPAKLVANVRHLSRSDNPAVLLLNPDSGHQSSGDQDSEFAEAALFWAFALACVSESA